MGSNPIWCSVFSEFPFNDANIYFIFLFCFGLLQFLTTLLINFEIPKNVFRAYENTLGDLIAVLYSKFLHALAVQFHLIIYIFID